MEILGTCTSWNIYLLMFLPHKLGVSYVDSPSGPALLITLKDAISVITLVLKYACSFSTCIVPEYDPKIEVSTLYFWYSATHHCHGCIRFNKILTSLACLIYLQRFYANNGIHVLAR